MRSLINVSSNLQTIYRMTTLLLDRLYFNVSIATFPLTLIVLLNIFDFNNLQLLCTLCPSLTCDM